MAVRVGVQRWMRCSGVVLALFSCVTNDADVDADDASTASSTSSSTPSSSDGSDDGVTSVASDASDGSESSSSDGSSSSGRAGSDASSSDASSSDDGSESTGDGACVIDTPPLLCTDPGAVAEPCDTFAQNCPDGEKCTIMQGEFGWEFTTCIAIPDDPDQLGEPCTVEDFPVAGPGVTWIDSCDEGLRCAGTCVQMCSCSAASPVCTGPNTFCAVSYGPQGALQGGCVTWCSPLDDTTCAPDEKCVGAITDAALACAPIGAGGDTPVGQPCFAFFQCAEGLACTPAAAVPGCAGANCCSAFCEVGDSSPCMPGQTCQPYFAPGEAPDACLASIGICRQ